ncbi:hypothetical protein PR048_013141 [Dryococelus australis]|uniref:Uncharacterized protein n=1 Tax=Dryococelus australis TaxID=614101 RepID=A0ABQ9HRS9_9NEOP|nr:hypothetical protein PR048_013141 [Dryococelus australis]
MLLRLYPMQCSALRRMNELAARGDSSNSSRRNNDALCGNSSDCEVSNISNGSSDYDAPSAESETSTTDATSAKKSPKKTRKGNPCKWKKNIRKMLRAKGKGLTVLEFIGHYSRYSRQPSDCRGKLVPRNKRPSTTIELIHIHIKSSPTTESHYASLSLPVVKGTSPRATLHRHHHCSFQIINYSNIHRIPIITNTAITNSRIKTISQALLDVKGVIPPSPTSPAPQTIIIVQEVRVTFVIVDQEAEIITNHYKPGLEEL